MAKFVISAFADEAGAPIEEQIKALKENGLSYIEPRMVDKRNMITLSDEELTEIAGKLRDAGIKVGSLGSPIGKYPIEDDFDKHLEEFDRALRACEIFGTDKMRIFSFYVEKEKMGEYRDEVMRRLSVLVERAKAKGITLCHENEAKIYGESPEGVADILASVPGLGGIFDAANYCATNHDPVKGIDVTLPKLVYVHIKDALTTKPGETMVMLPAGDGEGKIADALMKIDAATDRTVMLTLEPHLFNSSAFKAVDSRELGGRHAFDTEREAFDYALRALEKLLTECGFKEENGVWTK